MCMHRYCIQLLCTYLSYDPIPCFEVLLYERKVDYSTSTLQIVFITFGGTFGIQSQQLDFKDDSTSFEVLFRATN